MNKDFPADVTKRRNKIIAVDFDGVIHQYSKGWYDSTIYDPPMPGTKEGLDLLKSLGVRIIIFSVRATEMSQFEDLQPRASQEVEIAEWMNRYNLPYDEIWTKTAKPFAHIYLDDRAVRFETWPNALGLIKELLELE